MPYKISIIMPVYNAEKYLENSLDSIVNQTIGIENLQVIIVDDKSTDSSSYILEKYYNKYRNNFKIIHLKSNIGAAYGPKNIALNHVEAPYIMFLDSDDSFELDACEVLYNKIIKTNAGIVYGRYKRIYTDIELLEENKNHYINSNLELVQKSHSAFKDSLYKYTDDIIDNIKLNGIIGFLWRNIVSHIIYGNTIRNSDDSNGVFDEIYLEKLEDNINILRSLPSFWTKIYDANLILSNNIKFPEIISAEDLNFLMEAYFNADGIVFLNNQFVYNYYMHDDEVKSITKNITYKLVYDSLIGYFKCSRLCNKYDFKHSDIILNPFILNWIQIYKQANLSIDEKHNLYESFQMFVSEYNCGFVGKLLCKYVLRMINKSFND
ncbi:MAG: glycosyltransferase family 2 protein [Methanobrevibacter sp.]